MAGGSETLFSDTSEEASGVEKSGDVINQSNLDPFDDEDDMDESIFEVKRLWAVYDSTIVERHCAREVGALALVPWVSDSKHSL